MLFCNYMRKICILCQEIIGRQLPFFSDSHTFNWRLFLCLSDLQLYIFTILYKIEICEPFIVMEL